MDLKVLLAKAEAFEQRFLFHHQEQVQEEQQFQSSDLEEDLRLMQVLKLAFLQSATPFTA